MELLPYGIFCLIGIAAAVANERHELKKRIERETTDRIINALETRSEDALRCFFPHYFK